MDKVRFEELTKLINSEGRKEQFLNIIKNLESKITGIDNIKITCSQNFNYTFEIERNFKCKNKKYGEIRQSKEYVRWSERHGVIEWCSGIFDCYDEEV